MKFSNILKLNIYDLIVFFDKNKQKNNTLENVRKYFENRINLKNKLTEQEYSEIDEFINRIINSNLLSDIKKLLIKYIKKLLILSKSEDLYKIYKKKGTVLIDNISEKKLLIYFEILLKLYKTNNIEIENFIKFYLKHYYKTDKLKEILEYSYKVDSEERFIINKLIDDYNINGYIKQLYKELTDENITIKNVYVLLNKILSCKMDSFKDKSIKRLLECKKIINSDSLYDKIRDNKEIEELKEYFSYVYNVVKSKFNNDQIIKEKVLNNELILDKTFPKNCYIELSKDDNLEFINDERIITIDEDYSPDLDGAFSIKKENDIYYLKVFVSDVPVFLREHKEICKTAYERGTSMYYCVRNERSNIDMLPEYLSHDYLSLLLNKPRNVITFSYIIDSRGNTYLDKVIRNKIIVNTKLTPKKAKKILNSKEDLGLIQKDLRDYKKLCNIIKFNSKDAYLKRINSEKIFDLVGLTSILTNYYIGHNSNFAIYRNNGLYTKNPGEFYTQSTTPLRRFVSNINLAFFLEQNGVISFPSKDLNYVENNVEEINEHLNECENLAKFVDRNSSFVKKYIK